MRKTFRCAFALCAGIFLTSPGQAKAASLIPDSSFNSNSFISLNNFAGYTTQQISSAGQQQESNSNSQVQSNVTLSPSPVLSVSGSTNYGQSIGLIDFTYAIEVVGPATTAVPVVVNASGSVGGTATGLGGFFDSLQSTLDVNGQGVSIGVTTPNAPSPGSFNLNQSYAFQPNTPYYVTMIAEGAATANILGGTASFFATVDPTFTINPSFANAGQYSIELSTGVGNSVSTTPLPSTWGMMLMGLIGLGFIGYRQKSNRALMAA
jgi:hypothetical protein